MSRILQTPSILPIQTFDPSFDKVVEFYYEDNQPYKNRIVITDNDTSSVIYDKTEETMVLKATIPANTLIAGKKYLAQIQVFDINNNNSILSDPVLFYCYSNPVFEFQNVQYGELYRNASISLSLNYSQQEDEYIKEYQFFLYDENKIQLSMSERIYSSTLESYTFYGLENNTKYYLRATGKTVHDINIDTDYILINVEYKKLPANIGFKVENIYQSGYINIKTNIIDIGYEIENDNYEFKDSYVILKDNYVKYNDGFVVDDDFSLFVEAKKLPLGMFLTTQDDDISLSIINVCDVYYCKLNVKDSEISMCTSLPKARLSTEEGDIITTDDGRTIEIINTSYDDNEFVIFELKRKDGLYSLNSYYKQERMVTE